MSGYLQRLARSVMQPSERVHPMVGSVFSASANQGETEVSTLSFGPAARSPHQQSPERKPEQNVGKPHPSPFMKPDDLPRPAQQLPASNEATSTPSQPVKAPENNSVAPEREPVLAARLAQEREATQPTVYAPLMPMTEVRSEAKLIPKILPQIAPHPAAPTRRDKSKVEAIRSAEHEADDIQIHIGRIEVLAVPPAPPVVRPAKSAHKAPSLDDYLKHRDRRTL